jgi:hypothetical protein
MLNHLEEDNMLKHKIIFSDEATFQLPRKWNRHNVFCAASRTQVYGQLFFAETIITGHLVTLEYFFIPQLDVYSAILQQYGPLPTTTEMWRGTWTKYSREYGHVVKTTSRCHPDHLGFVKDSVYTPPTPVDLQELRERIFNATKLADDTPFKKTVGQIRISPGCLPHNQGKPS